MVTVSLLMYATVILAGIFLAPQMMVAGVYLALFAIIAAIGKLYFIGYLRGNAVMVGPKQFPEIFDSLTAQSAKLGLKRVPTMYLLQGDGLLNAFAARFSGRNYVVLYSDIMSAAYEEGMPAVEFVIGHELGHIKRNHVGGLRTWLILPAKLIPFLGSAYSRACEYTCDNIGYSLCPAGAEKGILILAAGRDLYKRVNTSELLYNAAHERGFATWFAEIFSTHPHIAKRVAMFEKMRQENLPFDSFVMHKDKSAVRQFEDQA
jgi:Zn-dependent protease with chaperone function